MRLSTVKTGFLTGHYRRTFIFIINKWIKVEESINWYIWAITSWLFIFILHFIKVFITDSFMNKNWEREQINRLMTMQEKKIEHLNNEVENKKIT